MNSYLTMHFTCDFDYRNNPVTGVHEFHRGMDFVSSDGFTYSGVNGVIRLRKEIKDHNDKTWEFGKFYQLSFEFKDIQFYANVAHHKEFLALQGDKIIPESKLGLQGSTGLSKGDHIHWECFTYDKIKFNDLNSNRDIKSYLWPDGRLFVRPLDIFKAMEV